MKYKIFLEEYFYVSRDAQISRNILNLVGKKLQTFPTSTLSRIILLLSTYLKDIVYKKKCENDNALCLNKFTFLE